MSSKVSTVSLWACAYWRVPALKHCSVTPGGINKAKQTSSDLLLCFANYKWVDLPKTWSTWLRQRGREEEGGWQPAGRHGSWSAAAPAKATTEWLASFLQEVFPNIPSPSTEKQSARPQEGGRGGDRKHDVKVRIQTVHVWRCEFFWLAVFVGGIRDFFCWRTELHRPSADKLLLIMSFFETLTHH